MPEWFVEKYKDYLNFNGEAGKECLPLSSKFEFKEYSEKGTQLPHDLQRVMQECTKSISDKLVFVWLHECGGITRVQITKDSIGFSEPSEWERTYGVTHDYCYECSDIPKATKDTLQE